MSGIISGGRIVLHCMCRMSRTTSVSPIYDIVMIILRLLVDGKDANAIESRHVPSLLRELCSGPVVKSEMLALYTECTHCIQVYNVHNAYVVHIE